MSQKISVLIITYNEEDNIKECLESVKWADEILVIDSYSTDRTVEFAKEFTDKIILTDETRYGEKRNIGINRASNEWILWLDADERISDELSEEIKNSGGTSDVTGFLIKRKTFFINKFIKHCGWYPDYSLRLFRKSSGIKFSGTRVHERIIYSGKTSKLQHSILHYTDLTFEHYIDKLNNYTTLASKDLDDLQKLVSLPGIILRPQVTFFKMYFIRLGILDGFTGLVLCSLSAISVFAKYSKLYLTQLKP